MQQEPVFRMYTRRLPWLPAAIIGSLFLLVGLAMALDPRAHNPVADRIGGVLCILIGAPVALYAFYFLITPTPVLRLDSTGMTYRAFPFGIRRARWEDVDSLKATTSVYVGRNTRGRKKPELTIYLTLKPHVLSSYGGHGRLYWRFDPDDLSRAPEEVVEQIRRFHPVSYDDQFAQSK